LAQAATDKQLAAISEVAGLNGIALQCRHFDEVQRIKISLIQILPKQRALGQWFEQETNKSFMAFMQHDGICGPVNEFSARLDNAILKLEMAFQ